MSELEYRANAQRFSGAHTVLLTKVAENTFAMHSWGGRGTLFYIGPPEGIAEAYENRPTYEPPRPKRSTIEVEILI